MNQVVRRVSNDIGIMISFGLVARRRTKMRSWPTPTPPPSTLVLGPSNSLGCFKSFPFIRLTNFPPSFHPDFARDDDRDRLRLRRHRQLGGVEEGRHDDDSPARPPRPRHGKGTRTGAIRSHCPSPSVRYAWGVDDGLIALINDVPSSLGREGQTSKVRRASAWRDSSRGLENTKGSQGSHEDHRGRRERGRDEEGKGSKGGDREFATTVTNLQLL